MHPSSDKENIRFISFLLDEARRLLGEMVRVCMYAQMRMHKVSIPTFYLICMHI